ncbi:hypothetical protein [Halobacteriovorax sp.]|uniref:hypothetical protein n=1 Tax=Halobacteriovorax sp. TaxID=2020862 RepID=UPI0035616A1E
MINCRASNKLRIQTSKIPFIFCFVVFLTGLYQIYLYFTGGSYDSFGVGVFTIIPLGVVNFIFPREIVLESSSSLQVKLHYLFRTRKIDFELSEIKDISLSRTRGGEASGNYSISIFYKDGRYKSIPLFLKLKDNKKISEVNHFLGSIKLS